MISFLLFLYINFHYLVHPNFFISLLAYKSPLLKNITSSFNIENKLFDSVIPHLEWNRPAELDFALDVDDFAIADPGGGGDAHRVGEAAVAELHDGQPIDLTDVAAGGVRQQGAAQDLVR